jgi:regulator of RNase E activity RraA
MLEQTAISSTSASDALTQVTAGGGVLTGLIAFTRRPVTGPAFTVRLCAPEESARPFNSFLDEIPAGCVIVVDNAGRRDASVFGGLMCAEATRRGALAAIVNGDVRDVEEARSLGFGLFALGRTPASGRPTARLAATGQAIDWRGVTIEPGDTVVADGDGAVVVPAGAAATVLPRAQAIEHADCEVLRLVRGGVPLAEARARQARTGPDARNAQS